MEISEVRRLQRELEELAGMTGAEGIRAASRLQDDILRALRKARAIWAADMHYLDQMSSRPLAEAISDQEYTVTQAGVMKWIRTHIGEDPLVYTAIRQMPAGGFEVFEVEAVSREQFRQLMDEGVRFVPKGWNLAREDVDPEAIWPRLERRN